MSNRAFLLVQQRAFVARRVEVGEFGVKVGERNKPCGANGRGFLVV